MSKRTAEQKLAPSVRELPKASEAKDFEPIHDLILQARKRALAAVNTELVDVYWRIGEHLSQKAVSDGWGRGTVLRLAAWLQRKEPALRGFSASNLWRMRQFFDTYGGDEEIARLVRALPWASNLAVLAKCKTREERAFYLRAAVEHRWPKRELERQIDGGLFERTLTAPTAFSRPLRSLRPEASTVFKDSYLLEFLQLPDLHDERDLQRALVANLKQFLMELGRDFCFVGQEFCIQVGKQDFFIDLLFFHRGLRALVAIELKIDDFKPAHLGQLEFYLEALDRDHKKPDEHPSIGLLLCKTRDRDVVEYALSRTVSPALVSEYKTKLPDKALLKAKLDEFFERITGG